MYGKSTLFDNFMDNLKFCGYLLLLLSCYRSLLTVLTLFFSCSSSYLSGSVTGDCCGFCGWFGDFETPSRSSAVASAS